MNFTRIADGLWGPRAKFSYLLLATLVLLLTTLGAKEIWTQEHRWADIVSGMFYRHDFLHPYLGKNQYYDKPLLSYWLIALLAKITGQLSMWALRLPSALAGVLAIWSIYRIGTLLKNTSLGLLSGWLLLTTYYFVFWARTSSADMLNIGGSLLALAWYMSKRDRAGFFDYMVFFVILALTSLCKGLIGAIVPVMAVAVDVLLQQTWRRYLRLSVIVAAIPAAVIYFLPFWISSTMGGESYGQSGLYLVYRENILRYFHPFDHQGPIYTYFLYLPIYLLPGAIFFFIPALLELGSRWKTLSLNSKWIAWTLCALFLFFTLSGSRRSYYVLPMVPFAILLTADWILSVSETAKRRVWAAVTVVISYLFLFLAIDVIPAWYYSQYGIGRFASTLQVEAEKIKPWQAWHVVLLDSESKLNFYLNLPPTTPTYNISGDQRDVLTAATILKVWPMLANKPADTIFISRKRYEPLLQNYFAGYEVVEAPKQLSLPGMRDRDGNAPVAYLPKP